MLRFSIGNGRVWAFTGIMQSAHSKKITVRKLASLKGKAPIVAITAYDFIQARICDAAGADLILVGDSMGNNILGFDTTVPVTLNMMVHHSAAVSRAKPNALVVADVPFGHGAGREFDRLLDTCMRLMQEGGVDAVKIEGTQLIAPQVAQLVEAGVPVLGHIGLHPQRVNAIGGYRKYGKTELEREELLDDATALEAAGAFAIVGEMIDAETAQVINNTVDIPLIGIGCGANLDGQISVITDVLSLGLGKYPAFTKQYANLAEDMKKAITSYADEVRGKQFP